MWGDFTQPIFKEYIQFLRDKGADTSWFQEQTFWLDNNIVKAFRKGGQVVPLWKVTVDDDLNVTVTKHKQNVDGLEFETWDETVKRLLPHLRELEADSIALIRQNCLNTDRKVVNTNSTGKDSMVVTRLLEKAGIQCGTYFNVTTLDVAESNRMAKRNGFIPILPNPEYRSFYSYIQRYEGGEGASK